MKIVFDMDGTIADLYGVKNWLSLLRDYNPKPFEIAKPMWDMEKLATICKTLAHSGNEIHIVTWLSKESTPHYDIEVTEAKKVWLEKHGFYYNHFHAVPYGTPKAEVILPYMKQNETAILFDDNAEVRSSWHLGNAIDPQTKNILKILEKLL